MEQRWDPEVKLFFLRILRAVSWGLIWMLTVATAGIYFKLAFFGSVPAWASVLYYVLSAATLFFLLRYIVRNWK